MSRPFCTLRNPSISFQIITEFFYGLLQRGCWCDWQDVIRSLVNVPQLWKYWWRRLFPFWTKLSTQKSSNHSRAVESKRSIPSIAFSELPIGATSCDVIIHQREIQDIIYCLIKSRSMNCSFFSKFLHRRKKHTWILMLVNTSISLN